MVLVTHRVAAIDGLVDEVVAIHEGRVASRLAGPELSLYAAQLDAQPVG